MVGVAGQPMSQRRSPDTKAYMNGTLTGAMLCYCEKYNRLCILV